MRVLVTGSSGHLGEALVRTLRDLNYEVNGIDILPSPYTSHTGSITDRSFVKDAMQGVKTVFHTATLHKPHIVTHSQQQFVDTNITGTLNLLQGAIEEGVESFIFTSTTSIFGDALVPPSGAPTVWITEEVMPIPKNIYGVTKAAAENLCRLWHRNNGLPCVILRTSRFFPEEDDNKKMRQLYKDENLKANEFLYRRVDVEDIVSACLLSAKQAGTIGFGTYIISATTPFIRADLKDLREVAPAVVKRLFPNYEEVYEKRGWKMFPSLDRVYDNSLARKELGWQPKYDFRHIINCLKEGKETRSLLAVMIGSKGYHEELFSEGPFPVEG
jgi:UDP-glucose 4-epimerase